MIHKTAFYLVFVQLFFAFGAKMVAQTSFSKKYINPLGLDGGMSLSVFDDGYLMTCNRANLAPARLIRTDLNGNIIWDKVYTQKLSSSRPDLTQVSKSKIFVGGITCDSVCSDSVGMNISILNLNGDTIHTKKFRRIDFNEYTTSLVYVPDSFLVLFGLRAKPLYYEIVAYKVDTFGNLISEHSINFSRNFQYLESARYANGKFYLSYAYQKLNASYASNVFITDTRFNRLKEKLFDNMYLFALDAATSNYVPLNRNRSVFAWQKDTTPPRNGWTRTITILYCLDSNLNQIWKLPFFDIGDKKLSNLKQTRNGDIVGVGLSYSQTEDRGWIFRVSSEGRLKWERHLIDDSYPFLVSNLNDIEEDNQGNIVATGSHYRQGGASDGWLIKIDTNGCIQHFPCDSTRIAVDVKDVEMPPLSIKVYPNPASQELNIDYSPNDNNDELEISLSDLTGKTVLNQKITTATTPLSINVAHLPTGIYFCTFSAKGRSPTTQKVVIAR